MLVTVDDMMRSKTEDGDLQVSQDQNLAVWFSELRVKKVCKDSHHDNV
jgi:hypothetical protein